MYDRAYAVATAAFLVAGLAALAFTVHWLRGPQQERRPYVVVSPYSVAGLTEGSELLYRGVPAGRVERIGIDPTDPGQVLIDISVDAQIPVLRSTFARLHQRGLTGIAQIELEHSGPPTEPLPTSERQPAPIPMRPGTLEQVTDAATQALDILNEVAASVDEALSEENRAQLRAVVTRFDALLASVEQLADTLEADLPRVLDNASRAGDSVAALADRTTASMDEVDALIADLRETTAVVRSVGEELAGGGTSGIDRALDAVSSAAQEVARVARELAREPTSLWRGREAPPGPGEE